MKDGFYGFSWTTFFFGCFPALFRGDFLTFIGAFAVLFILAFATFGIGTFLAMIVWAFFYNGYYTKKLMEKGYVFAGTNQENTLAAKALGVQFTPAVNEVRPVPPVVSAEEYSAQKFTPSEENLENDAYKIHLVKKYPIEFNELLKKYIFENALYDSIDDVLAVLHAKESAKKTRNNPISISGKDEAITLLSMNGIRAEMTRENKFVVYENSSEKYFYSENDFIKYAKSRLESKSG